MCKLVWHTETRKINELVQWDKNPRKISTKQKKELKKSLEKFNVMSIPVINTDNLIISGHQRIKILCLLGRDNEEIDVRVPNRKLTEDEIKEANIRENKNTGEFDYDLLGNGDFALEMLMDIGFDADEFLELTGNKEEKLAETEQEVKFYKKAHVLISIPVDKVSDELTKLLSDIKKIDGVEFEQSAN